MDNNKKDLRKTIKNLAFTKRLNILIGSGVSTPAIPLMGEIPGENSEEKNNKLVEYVKYISKQILNHDRGDFDIDQTYNNYSDFLFQIIQLLNMSNSRQVPKSVNIFTTNYDLFIEVVLDELSQQSHVVFNDGACGYFNRYIDSTNYNRVVSYKGLNDNYINEIPSINLIKPHGSVNWEIVRDKILVSHTFVENAVVVKPNGYEGQETFLNNYFHDMLRIFQLELDKPQSVLFVIGFSFQDMHIAKMFNRALQNTELIAYVFCFKDEEANNILKNLNLKRCPHNLKILSPKDFEESILKDGIDKEKQFCKLFTINSLTEIFKRY